VIATLALLALLPATGVPTVVELPDPTATTISMQVLVKLPELDARELAEAKVLAALLPDGTEEITRYQLKLWTSAEGESFHCAVLPDHLRLSFSVPKTDLAMAGLIIESVCRRATLSEDAFKSALDDLSSRESSYWAEALDPRIPRFDRIKQSNVAALYAHLFRPENIWIAVGGGFQPGDAIKDLADRFADWNPGVDHYPRFHPVGDPKLLDVRTRPITTVELSSPDCRVDSPSFAVDLVAASAMAVGKGSAVFRVAREAMGLSYKQDAFLWPSAGGLRLRTIVTFSSHKGEENVLSTLRDGLMKQVSAWTTADLDRAKAMLRASMVDGIVAGPICLSMERPLGAGLADRTTLAGYWRMKCGASFDETKLLESADAVTLDQLKATATELLTKANASVISGRSAGTSHA